LLSVVAGALIGANRERRRHPAGLRTTTLVSLAAAVAMIQANLLLPQAGKTADSFSVMDILRFPLGILSGIGFIGAGAILKKGDSVQGVTTAATKSMADGVLLKSAAVTPRECLRYALSLPISTESPESAIATNSTRRWM
jgi:uncharacterized membrane protein YhiD involved in acid resistance